MVPYLSTLKALVQNFLMKKFSVKASAVWNSQKMRLGDVEVFLWHVLAEILVLKDKLVVIMKSIDEGLSFLMGLKAGD